MWAAARAEKRASQARARRSMRDGWADPGSGRGCPGPRGGRDQFAAAILQTTKIKSIACPKNRTPWLQECAFIPPFRSPLLIARQEEEADPHFEPVIKLTERVETKTLEENEDVLFKMSVRSFFICALTRRSDIGVPSCSVSMAPRRSGRKEALAMFVYSSTRRPTKSVL